ncbi:MAG: hypothetical protein ACE5G9_12875 [Nitrospinales bacterium]
MDAKDTPQTPPDRDPQEKPPDAKPAVSTPAPKRRPLAVRFIKLVLSLLTIFLLLLAGASVVVEYYFPRETLRAFAQQQLSQTLKIPVTIGSVDFSLFRGIQVRQLVLGGRQPILRVQSLVLDYDLTQLAQGNFIINELSVHKPEATLISRNGVWNFQPLLERAGKPQPAAPKKTPATGVPPIPLAVDLKQLLVSDVTLQLDIDETTLARIEGLTLKAEGQATAAGLGGALTIIMNPATASANGRNVSFTSSAQDIRIETQLLADLTISSKDLNRIQTAGTLRLRNNAVQFGQKFPAPDVGINLQTVAQVKQQLLEVRQLTVDFAEHNRLALSGEIHNLLADPVFQVRVQSAAFDIGELMTLARDFLPPAAGRAQGKFTIDNLAVAGSLVNSQPENIEVTGGALKLDDFSVDYPDLPASLEQARLTVALQEIQLKNQVPQKLKASVNLEIGRAALADLTLKNFRHRLQFTATQPNLKHNDLHFSASADTIRLPHPKWGTIETGFHLQGSAAGDFRHGDFSAFDLNLKENRLVQLRFTGRARDFGRKSFSVTPVVDLTLNRVLDFLPPALLEKTGLQKLAGVVAITGQIDGQLGRDFQPRTAKARVEAALTNLTLRSPSLSVKNLGFKTGFAARFDASEGIRVPEITINAGFRSVHALDTYDIGPAEARSRVTIEGPIPLKGTPENIPLTAQLSLQAAHIQSADPAFSAAKLDLTSDWRVEVSPPENFRNLTLKGEISLNKIEAPDQLAVKKFQATLAASVRDRSLAETQTTLNARILAPRLPDKDLDIGEIHFDLDSRQNLQTGTVDIRSAHLALPSALVLQASGRLENWGKTFSLKSEIPKADLGKLWAILPAALRPPLTEPQGAVALSITAGGQIPNADDLENFQLPVEASGNLTLSGISAGLPDQNASLQNLGGNVRLRYGKNQAHLAATFNVDRLQKDNLQFSGGAAAEVSLGGGIPKPDFLKKTRLPADFNLQGKLALKRASLSAPSLQLDLRGIHSSTRFQVRQNLASVAGELAVQKMFMHDVLGQEWLDPKFVFHYALTDWDKFSIETQKLTVANRGAEVSATGRLEKLKPFLAGKLPLTAAGLARHADLALDTRVRLQAGKTMPVTPTLKTEGSVNSRIILKLDGGHSVELDGEIGFQDFNAAVPPSLKVNGVNGKFLFNKKLLLGKPSAPPPPRPVPAAERAFFDQLREFSPYKNILRIASVQFDQLRADHINLDLLYKDNRLRMEKFLFDTLSGSVAGNLFLQQTPAGPRLDSFVEFAGLDTQKLTGRPASEPGSETKIDGNIAAGFQITPGAGSEKISLNQLALKIAVTRIGDEALDRMMLFLDPQESQPAFAATRNMLKLASPHKVIVTLENGNLSLNAWLKNKVLGNIIQAPGLKRLPVGNLKNFRQISEPLQKLAALETVLRYLAARGITFDEAGGITPF